MNPFAIIGALFTAAVGVAVAAGCVFVIYLVVKSVIDRQTAIRLEWDRAAAALGVKKSERMFPAGPAIEGVSDGLHVTVRGYSGKGANTVYQVGIPFTSLRLTREGITSALGRLVKGDDVQTGDPAFDDKALLNGDAPELRAIFDAETRAAALVVFAHGGWVGAGKITIRQSGYETSGARIEERARAGLNLARLLEASRRTPEWERLAAVAAGDALPRVRENALSSLIEQANHDRAPRRIAEEAASRMLGDPIASNRLFAGTCGLTESARARRVIAALVWDPTTDDVTRARGLGALGNLEGVDRVDELLDTLLDAGDETRLAAIAALVIRRVAASRVTGLVNHPHGPTRVAAANALESLGDASVQPLLFLMLDDSADQVRLAAVRALGAIGDVGAVEKLLPLIPGFFGGDIKIAAEEAVARIQSRASGAGAGQLSVSDAPVHAGALSSVTAEEGALSEAIPGSRPPRKTSA